MLINISGSSGVGKTTLSHLIGVVMTKGDNVLHICGDDLHKWERNDANWGSITHLNPDANYLDKGRLDVIDLIEGRPIVRDHYDHGTGRFIKGIDIRPKDIVINEGLHSLYNEEVCDLAGINIFVDTDERLKKQWKINRDVNERGYDKDQVFKALSMREEDEVRYIRPQKKNADVVVRFYEKKDKAVHLEFEFRNEDLGPEQIEMMSKVKSLYDTHRDFLLSCKRVSLEYDLVQSAGGNMSYKYDDKLVISASGRCLSEMSMLDGFSVCDMSGKEIDDNQPRPSMETSMHRKIKDKIVLHTHPIHLNAILCSTNSESIIKEVLQDFDFDYVRYASPGKDLGDIFCKSDENKVVLLENHGLVCCGRSFLEVYDTSIKINNTCKDWLSRNAKNFKKSMKSDESGEEFLFPDAAVLPEDYNSVNKYILKLQKMVGLRPNPLSEAEIFKLINMEEEKYRKSIV